MYVLTRISPPLKPGDPGDPILAQGFTAQDGGYVTVTVQDGCVLSIQPSGEVQHRTAGTNGTYELAAHIGNQLAFCPDGAHAFLYGFVDQVPNAQPCAPPDGVPPEQHVAYLSAQHQHGART